MWTASYDLPSRFDRFRDVLKGTWKDLPLPGAGQTFDLGAHLIDQALVLFGRPAKVTAQISNLRGLGSEQLDDSVSPPFLLTRTFHPSHFSYFISISFYLLITSSQSTFTTHHSLNAQQPPSHLPRSPLFSEAPC